MFTALLLIAFLFWLFIEYKNFKDDVNKKIKILFENQKSLYIQEKNKEEAEKEITVSENNFEKQEYKEEKDNENIEVSIENESIQEEKTITTDISQNTKDDFEKKEKNSGFENIFMANIFNKIGAIAIVIATFIFLKILSDMGIFTETIKILTGYLFGLGIIYFAFKTHKNNTKNFAEVLMGTGFAVLFTTTFLGCSLLNVIPLWLGVVIGISLVITSFLIADKYNTFSMVAIGLIGGYISPFFTMSETSINFLFGYLILLNIFSILYVYKNTKKYALNYVNLIVTVLTITCYWIFNGQKPILTYPLLLWGVYLINDILFVSGEKTDYEKIKPLNYISYCFLILFTCCIFNFADKTAIGLTVLSAGIIYIIGAYICKNNSKNALYIHGFLLSLIIATHFLSEDIVRILALSAEAVILSLFAKEQDKKYLYNWVYVYCGTILAYVCTNKCAFTEPFYDLGLFKHSSISTLFLSKAILFGIPSISAFICTQIMKDKNKILSEILKILSVSYLYLFAVSATEVFLSSTNETLLFGSRLMMMSKKHMIYCIISALYSINIQFMNKKTKMALFQTMEISFYLFSLFFLISGLSIYTSKNLIPFVNVGTASFITIILATLYKIKEYNKAILSYIAVFTGTIFASCELGAICNINLSIIWTAYAGIIMLAGILKNIKILKISGIIIILLTILKILLVDLQTVNPIYKVTIFLLLGISLLVVSYFYNKKTK